MLPLSRPSFHCAGGPLRLGIFPFLQLSGEEYRKVRREELAERRKQKEEDKKDHEQWIADAPKREA
jgi:hypothetical protein